MLDPSRHEPDRLPRLARAAAVCGATGKLCPAERATQLLEATLATSMPPLLSQNVEEGTARAQAAGADTAIFYSISNCQDGLRGASFGNFLIKQVVEELRAEFPQLKRFSTLSPVPGFRRWLTQQLAEESNPDAALLPRLARDGWWHDPEQSEPLRTALMRLCALYLTRRPSIRIDPVARFHLGNGARLERINWLGNNAPRGIRESFGMMVNYLYDRDTIEDNREAFVRGTIVRSPEVDAILKGLGGVDEVDTRPRSVKRWRAADIATSTADAVRLDPRHPNNMPTPDERG